MNTSAAFAIALRELRKAKKMSQEDFSDVCSRVYMSNLENAQKNPTLAMIEELAAQMQIHPLTILLKTYLIKNPDLSREQLMEQVFAGLDRLSDLSY